MMYHLIVVGIMMPFTVSEEVPWITAHRLCSNTSGYIADTDQANHWLPGFQIKAALTKKYCHDGENLTFSKSLTNYKDCFLHCTVRKNIYFGLRKTGKNFDCICIAEEDATKLQKVAKRKCHKCADPGIYCGRNTTIEVFKTGNYSTFIDDIVTVVISCDDKNSDCTNIIENYPNITVECKFINKSAVKLYWNCSTKQLYECEGGLNKENNAENKTYHSFANPNQLSNTTESTRRVVPTLGIALGTVGGVIIAVSLIMFLIWNSRKKSSQSKIKTRGPSYSKKNILNPAKTQHLSNTSYNQTNQIFVGTKSIESTNINGTSECKKVNEKHFNTKKELRNTENVQTQIKKKDKDLYVIGHPYDTMAPENKLELSIGRPKGKDVTQTYDKIYQTTHSTYRFDNGDFNFDHFDGNTKTLTAGDMTYYSTSSLEAGNTDYDVLGSKNDEENNDTYFDTMQQNIQKMDTMINSKTVVKSIVKIFIITDGI